MRIIDEIYTQNKALDTISKGEQIILTFDHDTVSDEYGAIQHVCTGYEMTSEELVMIRNGSLPEGASWDSNLHRVFRTYQHELADNEYAYASRMYRLTASTEWKDYIIALDEWNFKVSALAETLSVEIPVFPSRPL